MTRRAGSHNAGNGAGWQVGYGRQIAKFDKCYGDAMSVLRDEMLIAVGTAGG